MRTPYAFFVAAIICGIVRAQDQSPRDWIAAHYSDLRTVSVQKVLHDAAQAGLITSADAKIAFKAAFQQLRAKSRAAEPTWKDPVQAEVKGVRPAIGNDNVFEHETNDGWQYADDMSGDIATGSVLLENDVDSWKFVAPAAGFYTFEVQATGLSPIADSWLTLRNHKGDPIANDDNGNGLLSRINVFLPAGTYYLDVAGYNGLGGGDYNLVAQSDAANVIALGAGGASGTTQIPVGGSAHDVFQFTAAEGRVNLQVNSAGNDTALMVQRADGVIYFSNDDSFVGGLDAAADIDLPAGTYYAYVWDIAGSAGMPFNVAYSNAAATLPALGGAPVVGSIVGDESLRLATVTLAAPEHVDVWTSNAGVNPVGDTIVTLFDRDLDYVCDVDDDDSFNSSRGFYSRVAMSLPAGTYYVGVNGYIALAGDFTLSSVFSPYAPNGIAGFGANATNLPGFGDIGTYLLDNVSQASVQVRGSDFWFGILGPDGELASVTRGASWQPQVGELPAGQSTLFVWDRYDFSGPLTASVIPPLSIEAGVVVGRGKEGDGAWLFANFTGFVAPFVFADVRGGFCLPFDALLMTVGDRLVAADGAVLWGAIPPGLTGVQLQAGDLHLGVFAPPPAIGTFRNGVQF